MEVGIIGASGLVGKTLISIIESRRLSSNNYHLFASSRKSEQIKIFGKDTSIQEYSFQKASQLDLVFVCSGSEFSKEEVPKLTESGVICIDNSSYWRMDSNVPLIVPEINGNLATKSNLIANPNCSTTQLVMCLKPLIDFGINEVVMTTYQSVTGAGQEGIDSLNAERMNEFSGSIFEKQIFSNLIPKIDTWMDLDETREEWKVRLESKKILDREISISCTAVRVPVENCHSEAVRILFNNNVELDKIRRRLESMNGVEVSESKDWVDCLGGSGNDSVFVGRLRIDPSNPKAVWMWIVSDNLRKGAALNAVQIAEQIDGFTLG